MTTLRKRIELLCPAFAVYFLLFGLLLSHPVSHNVIDDVYEKFAGNIITLCDADHLHFPLQGDSYTTADSEERLIGTCAADELLMNFNSICNENFLEECDLPLIPYVLLAYPAPVVSSNVSSFSNRAPPVSA